VAEVKYLLDRNHCYRRWAAVAVGNDPRTGHDYWGFRRRLRDESVGLRTRLFGLGWHGRRSLHRGASAHAIRGHVVPPMINAITRNSDPSLNSPSSGSSLIFSEWSFADSCCFQHATSENSSHRLPKRAVCVECIEFLGEERRQLVMLASNFCDIPPAGARHVSSRDELERRSESSLQRGPVCKGRASGYHVIRRQLHELISLTGRAVHLVSVTKG